MNKISIMEETAREYWDFIQTVISVMSCSDGRIFVYGLDRQRTELHDKLCDIFGLEKTETLDITDHLDKYKNFEEFLKALNEKTAKKGFDK